jgi:rhodanese-related sulfurtransferase
VTVAGVVLALAANALSPNGLKLSRNYFPEGTSIPAGSLPDGGQSVQAQETNPVPSAAPLPMLIDVPRLAEKGLKAIDIDQAVRFLDDPRRQQGLVIFVDARSDQHYQEGHIPGAYQFNPYRPEKHMSTVLPVCQAAEQIVVYCTGSDCEDSELAAILLTEAGIANQKLFVYVGGITEWQTGNRPVETGAQNSGNLRGATQ